MKASKQLDHAPALDSLDAAILFFHQLFNNYYELFCLLHSNNNGLSYNTSAI